MLLVWRASLTSTEGVQADRLLRPQSPPHLPLLPAVRLRHDRPQIPLGDPVLSLRDQRQKQQIFLNVRREVQQVHDLRAREPDVEQLDWSASPDCAFSPDFPECS